MATTIDTNKKTGLTVKKGDAIVVSAQGITVRGEVAVVNHWGEIDGWHMEIDKANVPGGYSSWKQRHDGGRIIELNGKEIGEDELPKRVKYTDNPERKRVTVSRGEGMGRTHDYIRNDNGRFIIEERRWSYRRGDEHLTCVLAYFATNNQYVTWMCNKEFESYAYGHYYDATEFTKAQHDFKGRD